MKSRQKFFACIILSVLLCVTCYAAFEKKNVYADGLFTDVATDAWYAKEVKSTYELGLMNGKGEGLFVPQGDVTVAEAITMAARAAAAYADEEIPGAEGAWYQMYINYAKSKGFVADGQFDNFDRPAKRYEVAKLFENAMPDGYFTAKNDVTDIYDIPASREYKADILNLYKAGVVMGSDSFGNFNPEYNITRAEAAAIINRVALPENRLVKTLDKISGDDAYTLVITDNFTGNKEGINSAWVLDNRGAVPRTTVDAPYSSLFDISESAGSALIREFNKTETGSFDLNTSVTANGDGVYLEFRNEADQSIYRLETVNGAWNLLGADGRYTEFYKIAEEEKQFDFHINIDLDNCRSTTYINDAFCGTFPLTVSGKSANLYNFRFATTDKSTAYITPGSVRIYANYALHTDFDKASSGKLPKEWTASENVTVSGMALSVAGKASASAAFSPVSGTACAEFYVILPEKESVSVKLNSGLKTALSFTSDENAFYVNGEKIYEDYYANMWYKLRFELDTDLQKILVKLNGKKVFTVPFAEAVTSVNSIYVNNLSSTAARFDNFKVFGLPYHSDYVPEPVQPAGEDKYNIGMNVCSLWTNGTHYGWSCISPYDDAEPVLGYYDEGSPETADWEIKFLEEHGIDFQAFCVFFSGNRGPQRLEAGHLFDGYMNAKYSYMSNFCIIWEAANGNAPSNPEEMKKNFAPYIVEYFFKDPRYMVIDNKPVVCVFGHKEYEKKIGGTANAVKSFEILEEEAKKLGFDGVIFLACGSSEAKMAELGYDGCYAYNWGVDGYEAVTNKNKMNASVKQGSVWTVPTVSVGFNNIAWNGAGKRNPMMSMKDYRLTNEWVRDEFLPDNAKEDWQKNFVMLSTWNEYGEGTYIMPTSDERGFGYLDTVREVYTDEKADASINTVPTQAQKARITRLYPQYRHLLRRQGIYEEKLDEKKLETVYTVDYSTAEAKYWSTSNPVKDAKGITGTSSNTDPIVIIQSITGKDRPNLSDIAAVRINAVLPKDSKLEFFWITDVNTEWSQGKAYTFPATEKDGSVSLTVAAEKLGGFAGKLKGLRIDPVCVANVQYTIKSVEFLTYDRETTASKIMHINGNAVEQSFLPQRASNGDLLVAFDPAKGLDFLLNSYYVWDKADKKLTLNFTEHTVVYTVGSESYILDGKTRNLGYKLPEIDGLPLIPIEKLCIDAGYEYSLNEKNEIVIFTEQKAYFDELVASKKEGAFEFNVPGDTENWSSRFMSLLVADGYMSCKSNSASTDPTIINRTEINMPAEKFTDVEFRVRYSTESSSDLVLQLFWQTNKALGDSEARSVKIPLRSKNSAGEWEEYTANLSSVSTWADTITGFRLDPFNASGEIDIDYIRFAVNPDYVDENTDPMLIPFALDNPDAEKGDSSFSNASIVNDPENPENKCYTVVSRAGSKTYAYAKQPTYFKPGYTYEVTARIKLASHGGRTDLDNDFKAQVLCNMMYEDSAGQVNHVVNRCTITPMDGWKEINFTFTVDPASEDRSSDVFSFYADPINGEEIGYYFDDIVVTEIAPSNN